MLGGEPGIGKDTALEPLFRAVGMRNVAQIQASVLEGQFNGWLNNQFVVVQEMAQGAGRYDLYNHMKTYLAAPPHPLRINEKNLKPYDVPNIQVWYMMTNKPDAVTIETGDRRHWVYWSDAPVQPRAYYDRLWTWIDTGGAEMVAGWLLARDISAFNPAAAPAWTQSKTDMARASLSAAGRWVIDEIEQGVFKGRKLVTVREFMTQASARGMAVRSSVAGSINDKAVSAALGTIGAKQIGGQVRLSKGEEGAGVGAGARRPLRADVAGQTQRRIRTREVPRGGGCSPTVRAVSVPAGDLSRI